ncbi:MAG: glycosyltransferase family 2 protein, partial [Sciscionella sp.]
IATTVVDFAKGFRLARTDASGDVPVSRWQFQTSYPIFAENPYHPHPEVLARILRDDGYVAPVAVRPLAEFLRGYQLSVGYTPGPVLAAALLAGIAGVAVPRGRRASLRGPCLLVCGLAVTVLVTSAVVEFSWRYQLPSLVLLPMAGVLGITAWQRHRSESRVEDDIRPAPRTEPDPDPKPDTVPMIETGAN